MTVLDYDTPATRFYHRPMHIACILTTVLAFPLVWMGGLVTSHGVGMSVPDWPNSYGYNMFALPFSMWLGHFAGGAFYEHTHRLLGTLVGLSALTATLLAWGPSRHYQWRRLWGGVSLVFGIAFIATLVYARQGRANGSLEEDTYQVFTHVFSGLAAVSVIALIAWRCRTRDPARWRRWLVTTLLGTIMFQGLMGGMRVTEISLVLAKLHGIFGQLVFAFAAAVAVTTSEWWLNAPVLPKAQGRGMRRFAVAVIHLVALQLILGAMMRHDPYRSSTGGGAGLSIPDWPLHYGKILPPMNKAALDEANQFRAWKLDPPLPPTTLKDIHLQFTHRLGAYITGLVTLLAVGYATGKHGDTKAITRPAIAMGVLVVVQISLGILTVLQRKPADIATAHQATGALLLMTATVLLVRVIRLYRSRRATDDPASPAAEPEAAVAR